MTALPTPPSSTAARAVLGALARKGLAIAGTALVTRGFVDQSTMDGAIPLVAEQLVGAALVGGATLWSLVRARITHTRFARAWSILIGEDQQGEKA